MVKKKNGSINVSEIEKAIKRHIRYSLGKVIDETSNADIFKAGAFSIRDLLVDQMIETESRYEKADAKRLYYLSMEFLMGRFMSNNVYNLGIENSFNKVLENMGLSFEELETLERDPALGNGGLGRLAACFLDSLATLDMPGYGYGINYEYGLFKQELNNGYQKEMPDNWLSTQTPWELERPEDACIVPLYGKVEHSKDRQGNYNPMWMDWKVVIGIPHDIPVVGYGGRTVNYLRLFSARSSNEFDIQIFNEGDYLKAVEQKISSETISKVLYPSDSFETGRELRLIQEYFLVACAIRDIVKKYQKDHDSFDEFPNKVAIQLNDTHPALCVAELMRLLVDEKNLSWERAWGITQGTLGYTNHTLMPEALEKWPENLFERVLPRHLQIIYEINRRFLEQVMIKWPGDDDKLSKMSIIEEGDSKHVRMANLAIVGSHSVNGVSELHSELVKKTLVPEFYNLWPKKFSNKTNGVTQRRWLLKSNPLLSKLITKTTDDKWITDLDKLILLEQFANDSAFQKEFREIKYANKIKLAKIIYDNTQVTVNPESLFDVQIKRIHEYKRQLLNVMHIIHQHLNIVRNDIYPAVPRTYIFAGKAAPGYWAAKQIIKLINNVGKAVNNDPKVNNWLNVVFIPDYRVSLAEAIIPAADLSEQISTAGMEASGTGNMKFAMNGALTIGTLDGANIEIMEEVGEENIFIFGLKAEDIAKMQNEKSYNPWDYYQKNKNIKRIVDSFKDNTYCPNESGLFEWIFHSLLDGGDKYFHLADIQSYLETQEKVVDLYSNKSDWDIKTILNVSRAGKFSSDRTIREYAKEIWELKSI